MTSEDYMGTREWDHEIELIMMDVRERLYDLKASYIINKDWIVIEDIEDELHDE